MYEVREGDTLEGVALKTGVRVSQLQSINKLYSRKLLPGQMLLLKNNETPPPPVTRQISDDYTDFVSAVPLQEFLPAFPTGTSSETEEYSPEPKSSFVWRDVESSHDLAEMLSAPSSSIPAPSSSASPSMDWMMPSVISWFHGMGHSIEDHREEPTTPTAQSAEAARVKQEHDEELERELARERDRINATNRVPEWDSLLDPPVMNTPSAILRPTQIMQLRLHLPILVQYDRWHQLYSLLNNGADIVSFFRLVHGAQYTLLLVQTDKNEVFGGFATVPWALSKDFYGSGESFVFRFEGEGIAKYKWTQNNEFFMFSNHEKIGMGGGSDGFAFLLDADFYSGGSYRSDTFGNPVLTQRENFRVKNVEVWGFETFIKRSVPKVWR